MKSDIRSDLSSDRSRSQTAPAGALPRTRGVLLLNWFERITGFNEKAYSDTKKQLFVRDGYLHSAHSSNRYGPPPDNMLAIETYFARQ